MMDKKPACDHQRKTFPCMAVAVTAQKYNNNQGYQRNACHFLSGSSGISPHILFSDEREYIRSDTRQKIRGRVPKKAVAIVSIDRVLSSLPCSQCFA